MPVIYTDTEREEGFRDRPRGASSLAATGSPGQHFQALLSKISEVDSINCSRSRNHLP